MLVADLVQYWTHRAYHEVPTLWRLHAVHHSVKSMDWLAGSRQHILELIITRTLVLAPIYVLGFSKEVIDAYIVIVGFQAVFNHANVSVRLGPLRYVIVTPNFHHWHHSAGRRRASTATTPPTSPSSTTSSAPPHKAERKWPDGYGVVGDYVPERLPEAARLSVRLEGLRSLRPSRAVRRRRRRRRRRRASLRGHCRPARLSVVLVDHAEKVAEKIRISGGGRCNFTNIDVGPANFDSANPDFCRSALARYTPRDFIDLVERHGIAWHEKHKGQLFCDGSSAAVIAMLLAECAAGGVERWQPCRVEAVRVGGVGFELDTARGPVAARRLVVATGGLSIPKIGASDWGYVLARRLGHRLVDIRPGARPVHVLGRGVEPLRAARRGGAAGQRSRPAAVPVEPCSTTTCSSPTAG